MDDFNTPDIGDQDSLGLKLAVKVVSDRVRAGEGL